MNVFGKQSLKTLEGVHPNLVKVLKESIKDCPIDFTVTDGGRTVAMQQALYAKGRTEKGGVVTQVDGVKKKSNHQAKSDGYYYAVDLYPYYDGKIHFNDIPNLKIIATHIKATAKCMGIKIGHGGDWKSFKDYPHFQLEV